MKNEYLIILIILLILFILSIVNVENFTGFRFYGGITEWQPNPKLFPKIPLNFLPTNINKKSTCNNLFPIVPSNFLF